LDALGAKGFFANSCSAVFFYDLLYALPSPQLFDQSHHPFRVKVFGGSKAFSEERDLWHLAQQIRPKRIPEEPCIQRTWLVLGPYWFAMVCIQFNSLTLINA